MRGQILSVTGLAILTVIALMATTVIAHTKATIPVERTLLGGRIRAAYHHINWEYKGNPTLDAAPNVEKGCAPVVVLDTASDPVYQLARPYVFYACGG